MWSTNSLWFEVVIVSITYAVGNMMLPKKKRINGWKGEPKRRYYEFRGWDKNIFKDK
jgi:hypothetical protein